MIVYGLIALLQIQAGAPSPADSARVHERARVQVRDFFAARKALVPKVYVEPTFCGGPRLRRDIEPGSAEFPFLRRVENLYDMRFGICPRWTRVPPIMDERLAIDRHYPPAVQARSNALRRTLIAALDSLGRLSPRDSWIFGQRVRMYVDAGDSAAAVSAVSSCSPEDWWCLALAGYVRHTYRDAIGAERSFDGALRAMPRDVRCEWENVGAMLGASSRRKYKDLSCDERDPLNANLWWLADPLYLEPANERRNEHFARITLIKLRLAKGATEYDMAVARHVIDPFTEAILRFGWPATVTEQHPNLWNVRISRTTNRSFIGVAYRIPATHTFPKLSEAAEPWTVTESSWRYLATGLTSDGYDFGDWAPEFYFRDAGPIDVLHTQHAFIRRQRTAVAVAAGQPARPSPVDGTARYMFGIGATPDPRTPPVVGASPTLPGGRHVIAAAIESRRQMMGVELVPVDSGPAWRARFVVTPPFPLDSLSPGAIAVSDVFLLAASDSAGVPLSLADAMPRMIPSTTISGAGLGLFWEVYGAARGDSLSFSVRIERQEQSRVARARESVGLAPAVETVTTRWVEEVRDAGQGAPGATTIRGRGINLNLSGLRPGRYQLRVDVTRGASVVSARALNIDIVR